jgi:hypothetical protein
MQPPNIAVAADAGPVPARLTSRFLRAGAAEPQGVGRRMLIGLILFLLAAANTESEALSSEILVGVWQVCYEPGLPGVSEVDQGFLVLDPAGRYIMMMAGIAEPDTSETGKYKIVADGVVLSPERRLQPNGRRGGGHIFKPTTLRLIGIRRVVLWPEKDSVRELRVLSSHGGVNYSWAKIL